jgi:anti-sigma regulatory factor (Ser/Thr protein kinase)
VPAPADVTLSIDLPSHPRYLRFVRELAGEAADLAGFPAEDRDRIELAVVEGFTNVIRHGYGGRTDQRIAVRLVVPEGGLRIELEDWGTWVDPTRIVSRPLDQVRPGGLGVHLMKATMDVVEYRRNTHGGTTLILEKRRQPAAGGAR